MRPPKVTIALLGTVPLYDTDELDKVLAAFEEGGSIPGKWSLEERGGVAYKRADVLARIRESDGPLDQTRLYLTRSKVVSYSARLALDRGPAIYVEGTPAAKDHRELFELGDRLAQVFRPDWGAVHVWHGARPWRDDDDRDLELMFRASSLLPIHYYKRGPSGLAMRTYIGPHYIKQFTSARIEEVPAVVVKQPWGGYRIDLLEEPWKHDSKALAAAWRAAMAVLRPANLFATAEVRDGDVMKAVKSPALVIGGTIRESK